MKLLLKILCAPIVLVLTVIIWIAVQIVKVSAVIMNFIAILMGLGALCLLFNGQTSQGIAALVAAFLLTPFGLPLISIALLSVVQRFKYWIQDCVYG